MDFCTPTYFLNNYILFGDLSLDKDKVIGTYAFTKEGLISVDEFLLVQDMIEINNSQVFFKPSKLIEGHIYKSDDGLFYLYIGNLQIEGVNYENGSFIKNNNALDTKEEIEKYFEIIKEDVRAKW